jgi:hypothetical protein
MRNIEGSLLSPAGRFGQLPLALSLLVWAPDPAAAQSCFHPQGGQSFGVLGDLNGSGNTNVADALCALLSATAASANPGNPVWPACLSAASLRADLNCDNTVTVSDVQLQVGLALGIGIPQALDPSASGCVSSCAPCAQQDPLEPARCGWVSPHLGGTVASADGQAYVEVPPAVLAAPIVVQVERVASPAVAVPRLSDVYEFGPDGLAFDGPVKVCLAATAPPPGGDDRCLGYLDTAKTPPEWTCEDTCLTQISPSFWCGKTNHFTNFAILLNGGAGTSSCESKLEVLGESGGTVATPNGAASVEIPPSVLTAPTPVAIARVDAPVVDTARASGVYDLTPHGATFTKPVRVCLETTPAKEGDGRCLGFLDESESPPKWKCEDSCLQQVSPSFWCGQTSHFTNFAVLLGSGGSSSSCEKGEGVVPSGGGVVITPDNGAAAVFPEGALLEPRTVTVTRVRNPQVDAERISNVYAFEPALDSTALAAGSSVSVCIKAPPPPPGGDNRCLGYLNTDASPPKWECQDDCLLRDKDGMVCGETDHFTNFAILLGGGASTDSCDSGAGEVGADGGEVSTLGGHAFLALQLLSVTDLFNFDVSRVPKPSVEVLRASDVYEVGPSGTTFGAPAQVCLRPYPLVAKAAEGGCLGYLDTSESPPTWKCEDPCLEKSDDRLCGETDHLTNFAILLSASGAGSSSCHSAEKTIGPAGGTVALPSGNAGVTFPPNAVSAPTLVRIEPVSSPAVEAPRISDVFDFSPHGAQFSNSATICLRTTGGGGAAAHRCLGYLDTAATPPQWKCQDECLTEAPGGGYCGKTDHFTNFAILLKGSGGAAGCGPQ